jgi:condensin complex subunit 1
LIHLRDELLDILMERVRDVNSFTRAASLRVWCTLLENEVIPVNRIGSVAELGVDRLYDKTAVVRKGAIGLITCLLDYNPFSGDLNAEHYQDLKTKLESALANRMDLIKNSVDSKSERRLSSSMKDLLADDGEEEEDGDDDDDDDDEEEETDAEGEEDVSAYTNDTEIYKLTTELSKCHSCLELLQSINTAVPMIHLMLASKTTSDVIEALRFFTRAINFGINGSATCLLGSLSLIWHQDESIQTECLTAFLNVFITDGTATATADQSSETKVLPANEIARNFVTLAQRLLAEFSFSEIVSLEKIISEVFKRKLVTNSDDVISALWQMVSWISFFFSLLT